MIAHQDSQQCDEIRHRRKHTRHSKFREHLTALHSSTQIDMDECVNALSHFLFQIHTQEEGRLYTSLLRDHDEKKKNVANAQSDMHDLRFLSAFLFLLEIAGCIHNLHQPQSVSLSSTLPPPFLYLLFSLFSPGNLAFAALLISILQNVQMPPKIIHLPVL